MPRKTFFRQPAWGLAALGAAGVLAFAAPQAWALTDVDRWRTLMEPADEPQLSENAEGAEARLLDALKLAENFDDTGEFLEQTMAGLGELYFSEGRYGIAVSFYRAALEIAEDIYDPSHVRHDAIAIYRRALGKAQAANAKVHPARFVTPSYPPGVPLRGMPVPAPEFVTDASPPHADPADLKHYTLAHTPVPSAAEAETASEPPPPVLESRTVVYFPDGVPQRGMPLPELTVASSPLPPDELPEPTAVEPEPLQIAAAPRETLVAYFPEGVPQRGMPLPELSVASSPLPPGTAESGAEDVVRQVVQAELVPGETEQAVLSPSENAPAAPPPAQQAAVPEIPPLRGFMPKMAQAEILQPKAVAATNTESGGGVGIGGVSSGGREAAVENALPPYDGSGPLVIRITPRRDPGDTAIDTELTTVARETWEASKVEVAGRRVDAETKALEADPVAPPDVSVRVTAAETAKQVAARQALVERHPVLGIRLPGVKRNTGPIFPETPRLADSVEAYAAQLEHLEKTVGKEHPDLAAVVYKMARLYHRQSRYELAAETYERCLTIRQKVLPAGHPDTIETFKSYIRLMRASGLSDQVRELRERMKEEQSKAQSAEAS